MTRELFSLVDVSIAHVNPYMMGDIREDGITFLDSDGTPVHVARDAGEWRIAAIATAYDARLHRTTRGYLGSDESFSAPEEHVTLFRGGYVLLTPDDGGDILQGDSLIIRSPNEIVWPYRVGTGDILLSAPPTTEPQDAFEQLVLGEDRRDEVLQERFAQLRLGIDMRVGGRRRA